MLDNFNQRAQQIYGQYAQERARVIDDKNLSDQGKRQRLAEVEANYKRQVGVIRDEAAQELDRIRQRAVKDVAEARAKAVEAKRQALGDVVYSSLLMRQMEAKDSAEIQRWFEEASEGFEKVLVGEYGTMLIKQRIDDGTATGEDWSALQSFGQAVPADLRQAEAALRDVELAERDLDRLDPAAHAANIGDRFGVRAEQVLA